MLEKKKTAWPENYRYIDTIGPEGQEVHCITYQVIGETGQCYYIGDKHTCELVNRPKCSWTTDVVKKRRKLVLKEGGTGGRRFAYTDKALALRSNKARKSRQLRHAQLSMERALAAIGHFDNLEVESTIPVGIVTIPSEYIQGLDWGNY